MRDTGCLGDDGITELDTILAETEKALNRLRSATSANAEDVGVLEDTRRRVLNEFRRRGL